MRSELCATALDLSCFSLLQPSADGYTLAVLAVMNAPQPDEFQAAVINSHSHSILVRSCAGSGKSTTLAARASALIQDGVAPQRILVLTFSVKSKLDLEAKMQRLCVGTVGGTPRVSTHHAKALAVLRAAGCSARVIEPGEQRKMMKAALCARKSGAPPREAMREATRQGLTMVAKSKGSGTIPAKGSDERAVLEAYQAALRACGQIDFEDMILLATQALRESGASSSPFEHLLLDEAQDTSDSQLALLQQLAPRGIVSVTAVGDADQTIYSFRGSKPDVLSRIASWWRCQTLLLPTNYRCGGAIVAAARMLIESSSLRESTTPLLAARHLTKTGDVQVHEHATRHEETSRLAAELRALQVAVLQPSEPACWPPGGVAVLCRTRAQVAEVGTALKAAGVTIAKRDGTSSSGSAMRQHALSVLSYLRLCYTPTDDDAFHTAIAVPPRTGFATSSGAAGGAAGGGLVYLRTLQRLMPSGADRGAAGASLLQAALSANSRNFPCVSDGAGSGALSLTRPQQAALRGFLGLVHETRERALRQPPAEVLEWLCDKVGLAEVLDKARKQSKSQRRAFTVRVPGEPMPARVESSSDDDDGGSDDEMVPAAPAAAPHGTKRAFGSAFGGAGATSAGALSSTAPSSRAAASVASLVLSARQIGESMRRDEGGGGGGGGSQSDRGRANASLSRFCDALLMSSHEEESAGGTKAHAVLLTTIHQSKGLEWDDVFIPLMTEGSLPLRARGLLPNSLELVEHLEEERRLCYVAYTRARKRLTLSWASEGPPPPPGGAYAGASAASKPSRFLPSDGSSPKA